MDESRWNVYLYIEDSAFQRKRYFLRMATPIEKARLVRTLVQPALPKGVYIDFT